MGSTFGEFCECTSAHGFVDFWQATHRVLRIFWALIIVAASLTIGYFVYQVVDGYQNAPLATNIGQIYSKSMIIPYVAVCNPAILNTTKMEEDEFSPEIIYTIIRSYSNLAIAPSMDLMSNASMKANFMQRMEAVLGEKNYTKFIHRYAYPCENLFLEVT